MDDTPEIRRITLLAAPANLFDPVAPLEVKGDYVIQWMLDRFVVGADDGMMYGAGSMARSMGGGGLGPPSLATLPLAAAIVAGGAVFGGIAGAISAHPEDEARQARTSFDAVFRDRALMNGIPQIIVNQMTSAKVTEKEICLSGAYRPVLASDINQSDRIMSSCGQVNAGSVLTLRSIYFVKTFGEYSPEFEFVIIVQGMVERFGQTKAEEGYRWAYRSPRLDFFLVAQSGAIKLRRLVQDAQDRLATRIVDDLFRRRQPASVVGNYYSQRDGTNFVVRRPEPDTVMRLPAVATHIGVRDPALSKPSPDD